MALNGWSNRTHFFCYASYVINFFVILSGAICWFDIVHIFATLLTFVCEVISSSTLVAIMSPGSTLTANKGVISTTEVTGFSIVTCHSFHSFRSDYCNCGGDTFLVFPLFDEHLQAFVRQLLPSVVKLSIRCSGRYLYTCWVLTFVPVIIVFLSAGCTHLTRSYLEWGCLKHSQKLHVCARVRIGAMYLTIIPRAWMGHEGERNNCFSKIQLVSQKYLE